MERNNFNLRDIQQDDLKMILEWRNSERVRVNMYNDRLISWAEHCKWFDSLKDKTNSKYKLFECFSIPTGVISFNSIDNENGTCFWGFYLGRTPAEKRTGIIMGFLGIEYAFEVLGIRKICGEAFRFNEGSIRFHQKLGFVQEGLFTKHILKNGVYEDIIRFALFRDNWMNLKPSLQSKLSCSL